MTEKSYEKNGSSTASRRGCSSLEHDSSQQHVEDLIQAAFSCALEDHLETNGERPASLLAGNARAGPCATGLLGEQKYGKEQEHDENACPAANKDALVLSSDVHDEFPLEQSDEQNKKSTSRTRSAVDREEPEPHPAPSRNSPQYSEAEVASWYPGLQMLGMKATDETISTSAKLKLLHQQHQEQREPEDEQREIEDQQRQGPQKFRESAIDVSRKFLEQRRQQREDEAAPTRGRDASFYSAALERVKAAIVSSHDVGNQGHCDGPNQGLGGGVLGGFIAVISTSRCGVA
ncbi:unnamed protein product [Amoebophrya sp. A25]|nr:unnamed protein product [Amoebophrya sp. A25]|eukprot:GSA25T00003007001.1